MGPRPLQIAQRRCNDFVTKPFRWKSCSKQSASIHGGTGREESSLIKEAAPYRRALPPSTKFYKELPAELAQIERPIERGRPRANQGNSAIDSGKAATAGKGRRPRQRQVVTSAESERSWTVFRQVSAEFARDSQPESAAPGRLSAV